MASKLLFKIDDKQFYKNHLNGTTHLLVQNFSKSDLEYKGSEALCDDKSEHLTIYNFTNETIINCPKCKMIKEKLNSPDL